MLNSFIYFRNINFILTHSRKITYFFVFIGYFFIITRITLYLNYFTVFILLITLLALLGCIWLNSFYLNLEFKILCIWFLTLWSLLHFYKISCSSRISYLLLFFPSDCALFNPLNIFYFFLYSLQQIFTIFFRLRAFGVCST